MCKVQLMCLGDADKSRDKVCLDSGRCVRKVFARKKKANKLTENLRTYSGATIQGHPSSSVVMDFV